MFAYTEISKRENRHGFSGLRYGKDPEKFVPTPPFFPEPTFKPPTEPAQEGKNTPSEQDVLRGEFLDAKPRLAGKRDVSQYEDLSVLRFDPLEHLKKDGVGYSSYDNGRFQSGFKGDQAFMNGNGDYVEGRGKFTTLTKQNPYQTKLPSAFKIHT